MLKFTDAAKAKVAEFMAGAGTSGAALRITIKARTADGFAYDFQLEDYHSERPTDVTLREGGFVTRIDPESAKYMKGATVDWVVKGQNTGFSVQNPNPPIPSTDSDSLKEKIIDALRTVFDPEIPVNIYELGLIYGIDIDAEKNVNIRMTLTAPNCPAAEQLPVDVETKTKGVAGVKDAKIHLVWEPPWDKDMMSDAAKLELGLL